MELTGAVVLALTGTVVLALTCLLLIGFFKIHCSKVWQRIIQEENLALKFLDVISQKDEIISRKDATLLDVISQKDEIISQKDKIISRKDAKLLDVISQKDEIISQKDKIISRKDAKLLDIISQKDKIIQEEHELEMVLCNTRTDLKEVNTKYFLVTKSLYPRNVFEAFEEKHRILNLKATGTRLQKWIQLKNSKVLADIATWKDLTSDNLEGEEVPGLAVNLYSTLSSGVHSAFKKGEHSLRLSKKYLDAKQISLMKGICRAYPLRTPEVSDDED